MNSLILLVVLIIVLLIAIKFLKSKQTPQEFPYHLSNPLLTNAERSFYGVLCQAVGNNGLIFSKVRIADVLSPNKGLSRSQWQRAFNFISSKHFDFVVCNSDTTTIKYVVELDDSSHKNRTKRDDFINNACRVSGLPLIRIKAAKGYAVEAIKNQINLRLSPQKEETSEIKSKFTNENPNQTEPDRNTKFAPPETPETMENNIEIKVCLKCGSQMVLRKAKSGKNAGEQFWGCSNFPKCRSVVPIDV